MSNRDHEIRDMLDRAWRQEEQKQRGFLTLSENDMRLLEDYYAAGLPYGNTPEGFNQWLEELDSV